jgi:hypothetical protein
MIEKRIINNARTVEEMKQLQKQQGELLSSISVTSVNLPKKKGIGFALEVEADGRMHSIEIDGTIHILTEEAFKENEAELNQLGIFMVKDSSITGHVKKVKSKVYVSSNSLKAELVGNKVSVVELEDNQEYSTAIDENPVKRFSSMNVMTEEMKATVSSELLELPLAA